MSNVSITASNLTNTVTRLIGFPTISSDHDTNRAALDWVEDQLSSLPLHVVRLENDGFPALIATSRKTKSPKVWLVAHVDVVTAAPQAFRPEVKDGRLYGRGAHDMKGALGAFISLLQHWGPDVAKLDVGLMVTSDEELGGLKGVKWLIEERGYEGEVAIIPDSGGSWEMEAGAKGIMWWQLTSVGKAAHASRTWDGVNALDKITKFIEILREHVPEEPCGDDRHGHATVNFASISGGGATNQVPDSATAHIDIRFPPNFSADDVAGWVEKARNAVPGITLKELIRGLPYEIKLDGPVARFQEIVKAVTGHYLVLTTAHGSSDARHFAGRGIRTINVSPTGSGFHVPDEWVDLEELAKLAEVVRRFTEEWAA